jgi:DNA polymerase-3 subunit gamma/tau
MQRVARGEGALFQKYAPMLFSEMVPTFTVGGLRRVLHSRGSRVFLFDGPAGTGKTSAARVLSLYVNCTNEESVEKGEPCLECDNCTGIIRGNLPDVRELNIRGIDEFKDLVRDVPTLPMFLRNKVYIIDETHRVTVDAQKLLLKTLENPPPHVFFIMCTTDPKSIISMIKDERCLRFQFKRLGVGDLAKLIKEVATAEHPDHKSMPAKDARMIADMSEGSPRRALQNLEKYWVNALEAIKEEEEPPEAVKHLSSLVYKGEWKDIARYISGYKGDPEELRRGISNWTRGMMLRAVGTDATDKYARILYRISDPIEGIPPVKKDKLVLVLYTATKEAKKL